MFGSSGRLEARVSLLEAELAQMRSQWLQAQRDLEELHRKNLNTIRSLRRAADWADQDQDQDPDPHQLQLDHDPGLRPDELARARARYGG